MSASRTSPPIETETLYEIIGAIAQGPDLDRVLRAVVDVLVHATACHACFIYLREPEGDLLRIRAASPVFAHVVGSVAVGMDEGLTGWVARNREPAFIREDAMDDPRMKYVPELEEERFQSMVAVPLLDRLGDAIGVTVLHTEAPREFGADVLALLVHVASLVAGAIENGRLYEQVRSQVAALSALNALGQRLASVDGRADVCRVGCDGLAGLLHAERCELSLFDDHGEPVAVAGTGRATSTDAAGGDLTARMMEAGRPFGVVHLTRASPFSPADARLLETAVNQLSLALRKAEMLERLTSENRVRAIFDALEDDRPASAIALARAVGWTERRRFVAIVVTPTAGPEPWEQRSGPQVEARLRLQFGDALVDLRADGARVLAPLASPAVVGGSPAQTVDAIAGGLHELGSEMGVAVGIGDARSSLTDAARALREAADAARIAAALSPSGGARRYDDLGPYRFLVRMIDSELPDGGHLELLRRLADHDRERGTELLATLEAYLVARGSVRATAEALFIHRNTLRQRLERIEAVTGVELAGVDWLSLELSLKLYRLRFGPPGAGDQNTTVVLP